MKNHRFLVILGLVVVGWTAFQADGVASGEFVLTDRIGEGSVFKISEAIQPEVDAKVLYFQDGRPVNLAQIKIEKPYCKFSSETKKLGVELESVHRLKVRFKNVAQARWFFDHGVELECTAPVAQKSITESDFHRALGHYFQVEKHALFPVEMAQWKSEGAV